MEIVALPIVFMLWYLFYDTKPLRKDEIGIIWEEENITRRIKIKNIFNANN